MFKFLNMDEVRYGAILGNSAWFGVGGPADVLFRPRSQESLVYFMQNKPEDVQVTTLGACSNVLIRDAGLGGVVIKLGAGFNNITHDDEYVYASGAVFLPTLSKYCAKFGLGGLEFLSGIPGTVGGALSMNSGCYDGEISNILYGAVILDYNGEIKRIAQKDFGFKYRGSDLKNLNNVIFLEAIFKYKKSSIGKIEWILDKISTHRNETQPVRSKTGGSTFKNKPHARAWELIDAAGCRGREIGGAQISPLHCNFIVNTGTATANDIESLIEEVKERVYLTTREILETEIIIIGRKN